MEAATHPTPDSLVPPAADARRRAKQLYWMGWAVTDIAEFLDEPRATVASWKARDGWDTATPLERAEGALEARFVQLVLKDPKTGSDYKEIDLLGRQMERFARIRRYEQPGGHEGDLNQAIAGRNAKAAKHRPTQNAFSEEQAAQLVEKFRANQFEYQAFWEAAGVNRTRVLLKSRQIGATYFFAREALVDAVQTGRNQIVLSASKAQAHVWRQYMAAFAEEVGVKLTGDPITLWNGAIIYFLGTNARTAQGYHGNFYFDEFFWTFRFAELNKVASMMAAHKKWRKTYLSSPSSITHEAYAFWSGEAWNKGRAKDKRQTIDISHAALADGALGPDRIFRHILDIEDAIRGGFDLMDLEELREQYSPDEFANLLMCQFIDDTQSVFPLAMMRPCMVDAMTDWDDVNIMAARPYAGPVWIGYDPSYTGDSAALVVMAPPTRPGAGFRILEKMQFRGLDFAGQAEAIQKVCKRYTVAHIAIDSTGMGQAVLQLVKQFYPAAKGLNYTAELKQLMVLKAADVIRRGRLQFDAGWTDVATAFMMIRKTVTASGRNITYEAGRSAETGHADLAWAIMHVLINEPLEVAMTGGVAKKSIMEISGDD